MRKNKNIDAIDWKQNIPDNLSFGDSYTNLKVIGNGAVGKCFLVIDQLSNSKKVIKVIKDSSVWDSLNKKSKNLLNLKHNNIVGIDKIEIINGYPCVVQEYVSGSSLDVFSNSNNVTVKVCFEILNDILYALQHMQKHGLSHKDIKPSNVIYDPIAEKATLVDLDYVSIIDGEYNKFLGTIKYSAPEQVLKNDTSVIADCYSLGLVIGNLIIGEIPFYVDLSERSSFVLDKIKTTFEHELSSFTTIGKQLYNLLKLLLSYDPLLRITVDDAIKYIEDLKNECTSEVQNIILRKANSVLPCDAWGEFGPISLVEKTFVGIITSLSPKTMDDEQEIVATKVENRVFSKNKHNLKKPNTYREQLVAEYDNILLQAKISFFLWVFAMAICFGIIIVAMALIVKGLYIQGLITSLLDVFVLSIQRLFHIREDHYRKQVERKMNHLETGDYLEYAFEKAESIDNPIIRDREAMELLKRIKEYNKMLP